MATKKKPEKFAKVYRPNVDFLRKNESLSFDSSAYLTFNRLTTVSPSLSFDILAPSPYNIDFKAPDKPYFPLSVYIVAGSQASAGLGNKISVYEFSGIEQTIYDDRDDVVSSSWKPQPVTDAVAREACFAHEGEVNKIRAMPQDQNIVASWSADSNIYFWDIETPRTAFADASKFQNRNSLTLNPTLLNTLTHHQTEGFALCWSKAIAGAILTGDCNGEIHFSSIEAKNSRIDTFKTKKAFRSAPKGASVEDIQWSPAESHVFVACSTDRSITIWDTRAGHDAPVAKAEVVHKKDVNVVSWNPLDVHLLASGSDDNSFKIWDLRFFDPKAPMAHYNWHQKPISSLEWSPSDESVLLVGSEDDTLTVWDLSLEEDTERAAKGAQLQSRVPAQLFFVHMGQKEVKEARFHPTVESMVISTALDGFDLFIAENMS